METKKISRVVGLGVSLVGLTLVCAAPALGGSALTYHALTPCRLVDTRATVGGPSPLAANEVRAFNASGSTLYFQGGTQSGNGCLVPPIRGTDLRHPAEAIAVSVVAVNAGGPGDLRVFPGDAAVAPLASIINYVGGQTIAVGTIIPLRTDQVGDDFKVQADVSGTHLVVDVIGYYSRATATAFVSHLNSIPAAAAGESFTRYGPITGIATASGNFPTQRMLVPQGCRVDRFEVYISVGSTSGIRTFLLKRDPDIELLNCGIAPSSLGCRSAGDASTDNGNGSGRLYIETFNFGAVAATDALIKVEMVCE